MLTERQAVDAPAQAARPRLLGGRMLFSVLFLLGAGLLIAQAQGWVRDALIAEQQQLITERLALYKRTIAGELQRYRAIPYLVARTELVREVLQNPEAVLATNLYLEEAMQDSGADVIYVMNREGTTVAAGNWRAADSFVGGNYSFRDYFRDAVAGAEGGQFAIGVTSRQPGYYISRPVELYGEVAGVAVVKIDLSEIERSWGDSGQAVLVVDQSGVVALSGVDAWRFQRLADRGGERPIEPQAAALHYGREELPLLELAAETRHGHSLLLHEGRRYLYGSAELDNLGWTLLYLLPMAEVERRHRMAVAAMLSLAAALYLLAAFMRERQEKLRSLREARDAAEIRAINVQLQQEIDERRRAEQELKLAEAELVQAAKLAALGQMSASVAHEINQPLAALQTDVASARLLLQRDAREEVLEVLDQVEGLVRRMSVMTRQLKSFARKSDEQVHWFDLRNAVADALLLLRNEIKRAGVEVVTELPDQPVQVLGEPVRLEQVLVNLIRNAVDAMAQAERRQLRLAVTEDAAAILFSVEDSGPGLAGERQQLFEPFFTTKRSGEGLGLGLPIAERIVTGMGGAISAANRPQGGARFTVRIPKRQP